MSNAARILQAIAALHKACSVHKKGAIKIIQSIGDPLSPVQNCKDVLRQNKNDIWTSMNLTKPLN